MTKSSLAKRNCVPGSSRDGADLNRFRAQMERAEPKRDVARGERIKEARARARLSQAAVIDLFRQAAERAGERPIGLRGYQEWEIGGGIRWHNAKLLAEVLPLSAAEIMGIPEPDAAPDLVLDALTRIESKIDEVRDVLREALGVSLRDEDAVPSPPEVLVRADSDESRTETDRQRPANLETRRRGRRKPTA